LEMEMIFQLRTKKALASVMFSIESFIECIRRKDSVVVEIYDEVKKPKAKDTKVCLGVVTYKNLNNYKEFIWIDLVPEEKVKQVLRLLRSGC
jgi:peptide deformylase